MFWRILSEWTSSASGEHHRRDFAISSPEIVLAAIAGRTKRIRLRSAVTVLETCTAIARSMVGRWGMSEQIGPISVFPLEGDPRMLGVSEGTLDAVATEIRRLVDDCFKQAIELLSNSRPRLDAIVERLLAQETLGEIEVYEAAGLPRHPESSAVAPVAGAA